MKKLFISQPMRGLTEKEILEERNRIKNVATKTIGEPIELIDSFIEDYPGEINKQIPVWYLGKAIQLLSQADIAYFGGDWKNARGCRLECAVASVYGIEVMYEEVTCLPESPSKELEDMILADLRKKLAESEAETKRRSVDPNIINEVAKEYTPIEIPADVVIKKLKEVEE